MPCEGLLDRAQTLGINSSSGSSPVGSQRLRNVPVINRHVRSLNRDVFGGCQRAGTGWEVMYTFPPCCWPSQQLHSAPLSLRIESIPPLWGGRRSSSDLRVVSQDILCQQMSSSMTACIHALVFSSSLSSSSSVGQFCFFF